MGKVIPFKRALDLKRRIEVLEDLDLLVGAAHDAATIGEDFAAHEVGIELVEGILEELRADAELFLDALASADVIYREYFRAALMKGKRHEFEDKY